ncbi:MBL fold metallo-hydrolase [Pelomyxa schiedti]|nr:MBL fold metallo-hydrolase [Pelomyxa schiedti]
MWGLSWGYRGALGRSAVIMGVVIAALVADTVDGASPFRITFFDVGQADSQLIQFPSGYSILFDCGETNWNSAKNAKAVASKLTSLLGGSYIDVVIVSHLHTDHVGYAGYGGMWYLFEKAGFTAGKFLNRNAANWVDSNGDGSCDIDTELDWIYAGEVTTTMQAWQCYSTNPNSTVYSWIEHPELCSTTQISPPDSGASVIIASVDGRDALMKNGNPVTADHTEDSSMPPNENDYSVGIVLRYGGFTYASFGDLDGVYDYSGDSVYDNIEAVVGPRVGQVDVYKVNHHGSMYSSNEDFVDTLNPQVSVISCGCNNTYSHPDQTVLNRLLASGNVFLTEKGNPDDDYGESIIADTDIVVESLDGGATFTVSWGSDSSMSFTSRKATAPTCA